MSSSRAFVHRADAWRCVAALTLAVASSGWLASVAAAPQAPALTSAGIPHSRLIDAATLLDDLRILSADDMEGRKFGTAGGARARAFVLHRFKAAGIAPLADTFEIPVVARTPAGEVHGANIVGVIRGTSDPEHYLILSAHYDHVGVRGGNIYNGADDNASGTAALFSIAQYLSTHRPRSSVLVVAFDGEEAGLVGSRQFVKDPPVPRAAIRLDLNMDMLGRDARDTLFVTGTARQPNLRGVMERVAASAPVHLRLGHDGGDSGEDWTKDSDHYAFIEAGLPALYFGVEDYAQLHRPTDDFGTITYGFYVKAVETVIAALEAFDASDVSTTPAR
jgi:Zn-dependent M28 family amino/carboxypeptidase